MTDRYLITLEEVRGLADGRQPPYLSLYLPTHRHHPENQQDPIRYKNLMKALEGSLLERYSTSEADALLDPFRALADHREFWNHTWDGLAVLGAAGLFRVIKLQRPVPERAVAADSFHIKPLLRYLQSADRYQVLSLNRQEIRLFEGNRDNLDEVKLAGGVPRTVTEALGDELTEPHQTVTSHGGTVLGASMRHGHGSKTDEIEIDEERFFRAVDRPILEHHSRPTGLPLILAALAEYHALFRKVSHNPFLTANGLEVDASALTTEQLGERAWAVLQPDLRASLSKRVEAFSEAQAKQLGSDDLAEVAQAAAASRVESLLVEAGRRIPGVLDQATGAFTLGRLEDPQVDDLLDDIAELVLSRGGQVAVIPAADMPGSTGVAATFRF